MRPQTDPWSDAGRLGIDRHARPALANIGNRVAALGHAQAAGAVHVVPLRLKLAFAVEHLDAVILPVRHVDPAIFVATDVVHDIERAGLGARLAPGVQQFAAWGVSMHPCVAITVRHVDVPVRGQRRVGAAVHRIAAHIRRGIAGDADLQEHFAVGCHAADGVVPIVGAKHGVVGGEVHPVRADEQSFPPGPKEIALPVEDGHGMVGAAEDVDVVFAVHADGGDFAVVPAVGELAPVLDDFVAMCAFTYNDRHDRFPLRGVVWGRIGRVWAGGQDTGSSPGRAPIGLQPSGQVHRRMYANHTITDKYLLN